MMPSIRRTGLAATAGLVLLGSALGWSYDRAPVDSDRAAESRARPQVSPRLVVLLVVDQLPVYLLRRLDSAFSQGLRRLIDEGFSYTNATHDHAITETAPGHASISTGTHPAKHGIPANDWYEGDGGRLRLVYNIVDPETRLVDDRGLVGASPRVLRREGLADWMQEVDADSRVVSISGKDRGAVLLAAKSDAHAYWFDATLGRFVTSRHYRRRYPGWVNDFNDDVLPDLAAKRVWELEVPDSLHSLARGDAYAWEGDAVHTTFPHALADRRSFSRDAGLWSWWSATPALDRAALQLAMRAVDEEELGLDDVPDLLAVSLSGADRVGHGYGPGSLEQLDNLWRLDRELGGFLEFLDDRLGEDGYVLALSSDHGVLELPEIRADSGRAGVRLTSDSANALQRVIDQESGRTEGPQALARALAARAPEVSWVARAWHRRDLENMQEPTDSFTQLQLNAHVPGRRAGLLSRAGVEIQLAEGVLTWSYPTGTGHGSPYHYDRHVPMIFFGAGIPTGASDERASVTDIAPTLARLLDIPFPDDLDGVARPLGGGRP